MTNETVLANSNRRRMKAKFTPAVTGCVTAAAPKAQLRQEEVIIWHHAIRTRDLLSGFTPVHSNACPFVNQIWMVATWCLQIMVWHESEQAVWICVAVSKLDAVPVGFEALEVSLSSNRCWENSEEEIVSHERILWTRETRVTVDQ